MGDFGKNRLQFKVMKDMALTIATAKIFDYIKLWTCLIQLDGDYAELCLGILIFSGSQRTKLLLYRRIA